MGTHGVCWKRAETGDHYSNLEDFIAWLWLREGNSRTSGLNVNPDWLDWFQGYPIGHTDLQPLETQFTRPSSSGSDGG
jgi:hypothetical protein